MHHHPSKLQHDLSSFYEITKKSFHLLIHGHEHEIKVFQDEGLVCISAPAFGNPESPFDDETHNNRNAFAILRIKKNKQDFVVNVYYRTLNPKTLEFNSVVEGRNPTKEIVPYKNGGWIIEEKKIKRMGVFHD